MIARDSAPETPKMAHDSLVTVRLSEPDPMVLDSPIANSVTDTDQTTPTKDPVDDLVEIPVSPLSPKLSVLVNDKDELLDDGSNTLIKEEPIDTEALLSPTANICYMLPRVDPKYSISRGKY